MKLHSPWYTGICMKMMMTQPVQAFNKKNAANERAQRARKGVAGNMSNFVMIDRNHAMRWKTAMKNDGFKNEHIIAMIAFSVSHLFSKIRGANESCIACNMQTVNLLTARENEVWSPPEQRWKFRERIKKNRLLLRVIFRLSASINRFTLCYTLSKSHIKL